jgi:hypothetical protein
MPGTCRLQLVMVKIESDMDACQNIVRRLGNLYICLINISDMLLMGQREHGLISRKL